MSIRLFFFVDSEMERASTGRHAPADGAAPAPRLRPRLHPDLPAVALHDLFTDRQSDPRPGILILVMKPLEDDEYLVEERWFDADAVIRYRYLPAVRPLHRMDGDHRRRLARIFQRIAQQVLE